MLFVFAVSQVVEQSCLDAHVIGKQEINRSADFASVKIGVPVHFAELVGLDVAHFHAVGLFASQSSTCT